MAHYRVVIADTRSPRDDDNVCIYNPLLAKNDPKRGLNRIKYWFKSGKPI